MKHISARVAWHNDGWDGHICKNPKKNTYCVGRYSYPGDMISEERDLDWEMQKDVAGCSCTKLDDIPACMYSINAFGKDQLKAHAKPPEWFKDDSETKVWDLPPSTICVWPYEEMYGDDVNRPEGPGQRYDYDKRLENAKQFFNELEPDKTLIFYYSNYSNPFSEDDDQKYVIVGISRLKFLRDSYLFYDGVSEENKKKYAGGFVWQMPITSHYPDQGFRIPYHLYLDKPEIVEKLVFVPENDRNFKYATRQISNDDALDIVEGFLEIVENLIELGDKSENWVSRKEWLQSLIAELWKNRGGYPGLPKVLDYLGFYDGIEYFKNEMEMNRDKDAKESIFLFLNGKEKGIHGIKLSDKNKNRIVRQWRLKEEIEQKLLSEVLPRFDISTDQIKKIFSSDHSIYGIYASLKEIYENPYVLCEQFIGENPDDKISFNKIDHGIFPSPELGLNNFAEIDDGRRLRGLCVERLKKEEKHTFVVASKIIHDVNYKLSFFPEWKRHQFNERYLEVDYDVLSKALIFREENDCKYIYLKDVYEDEREIEKQIRSLAKRPDITFKSPVTESHWHGFLYDSESPIAERNPGEYENAIKGQIEVCQKIFVKPICVVSGTAGTGKTTIIRAIINAIEKAHGSGTSFQLLAPTGKAAERIREKTEKSASTIHSFLAQRGWLNDNLTFKRTGGSKEDGITTYIIDESSMMDLNLVATLFRAINWSSVQRLIFVGDSNQLPPIGRGRVFADIIDWLKEQNPEAQGILEMNIRQMENRLTGKGTGILDLASLYVRDDKNTENKAFNKSDVEDVLKRIQEGGEIDKDLRVIFWKDTDELEDNLLKTIILDLEKETGEQFNEDNAQGLWYKALKGDGTSQRAEYQQIISPYRGELFGTDNLNAVLQKFVNGYNIENKGSLNGITIFDKVIQYHNRPKSNPYWAYNITEKKNKKIEVYNGEIGFVKPHAYDGQKWKWKNFHINKFQVVFSRKKDYWIDFKESQVGENLELAYAISVHKAQGSEFDRIYFILPKNKKALLSTELLYTGITRAQKHLTILVEEDISPFLSLLRPEKSHLLGINSSLFDFRPVPDEILTIHEWYEEGKIHQTLSNYMVRSKSEVIIANMFFERDILFKYEMPLYASDGTFYLPDFTIIWNGEEWYWEHLGLLDQEKYRNHWETKKSWYDKHFQGRLITTEESGSLSKDAEKIIEKYFT